MSAISGSFALAEVGVPRIARPQNGDCALGVSALHVSYSLAGCLEHVPLSGLHWFFKQSVSNTLGQVLMVAGFTLHWLSVRSQYKVPLQKSPSSFAAHSASLWHGQITVPGVHLPVFESQTSPTVQPVPSSQMTFSTPKGATLLTVFGIALHHGARVAVVVETHLNRRRVELALGTEFVAVVCAFALPRSFRLAVHVALASAHHRPADAGGCWRSRR